MGLSTKERKKVNELAAELAKILGGSKSSDGKAKTFAQLEDECIEATDLLSTAVLQLRVEDAPTAEKSNACPSCGRACSRNFADEPRVLQTDRGEVTWLEPAYDCPDCRRSFFPSGCGIGPLTR